MSPAATAAIAKLETAEDDLRRCIGHLDYDPEAFVGTLAHLNNALRFVSGAIADLKPAKRMRPILPLAERVLAKVERDIVDGCHVWRGAMSAKRNGRRPVIQEGRRGSKVISVARWVCEQKHGPAPSPEHEAAHTCPHGEREDCVNPDHLVWMTRTENERSKRRE